MNTGLLTAILAIMRPFEIIVVSLLTVLIAVTITGFFVVVQFQRAAAAQAQYAQCLAFYGYPPAAAGEDPDTKAAVEACNDALSFF